MAREGASLAYSGHITPDNRHKFQEAISRMTDINVQDQVDAYKKLMLLDEYMNSIVKGSSESRIASSMYHRARNALSNIDWEKAQRKYKISNMYGRSQIQDGWNVKS